MLADLLPLDLLDAFWAHLTSIMSAFKRAGTMHIVHIVLSCLKYTIVGRLTLFLCPCQTEEYNLRALLMNLYNHNYSITCCA